ncbi:MAG: hypothetical protein AAGF29_02405 [Pseudomonadota bacterium]
MKKFYYPPSSPEKYWEYWENSDGTYTVHWGALGDEGEKEIVKRRIFKSATSKIDALEKYIISEGYSEIDFDDHKLLLIEYLVEGFGDGDDLDKRHSLENLMNETLGWTGLGHCDGGSVGSGTMEVCCLVVDYKLAERIVANSLKNTEFSDYNRIYEE